MNITSSTSSKQQLMVVDESLANASAVRCLSPEGILFDNTVFSENFRAVCVVWELVEIRCF